jgi:imidazoleglycerol-phosphate dehydratase
MMNGRNNHHIAEAIFKGFGRAVAQAVSINKKNKKIPSTKGVL